MFSLRKLFFLFFILFFVSTFAMQSDLLYLNAGLNNVRRKNSRSTEYRLEYKFKNNFWIFNPLLGFSITSKKQTYTYGGIAIDLVLKNRFAFVPNFSAGYYNKGNGKDLGFPLEFRTGIEASWILKNLYRFGVHFSHTSNASLGRKNPGLETLVFFVAVPFRKCK